MTNLAARIQQNLDHVSRRIEEAADRAGRGRNEVRLIAVTKYVGADTAAQLVRLGCRELGESRPQQLWDKAARLAESDVRWHLIGHLQRNKIRRTLPLVSMIQSVDSLRLLRSLDTVAVELDRDVDVLLEVNVSGDVEKHGFLASEVAEAARSLDRLSRVRVKGLMTMASRQGDLTVARDDFRRLYELREQLRVICPQPHAIEELSMGMSRDFDVAIEEGATIVRVGSALFEGAEP